jgi:hypothetical protein
MAVLNQRKRYANGYHDNHGTEPLMLDLITSIVMPENVTTGTGKYMRKANLR